MMPGGDLNEGPTERHHSCSSAGVLEFLGYLSVHHASRYIFLAKLFRLGCLLFERPLSVMTTAGPVSCHSSLRFVISLRKVYLAKIRAFL